MKFYFVFTVSDIISGYYINYINIGHKIYLKFTMRQNILGSISDESILLDSYNSKNISS